MVRRSTPRTYPSVNRVERFSMSLPQARSTGLVVKQIGPDLLIFDETERRAHSVNEVAATVWRACDGTRDRDAIAATTGVAPDLVDIALQSLRNTGLLE